MKHVIPATTPIELLSRLVALGKIRSWKRQGHEEIAVRKNHSDDEPLVIRLREHYPGGVVIPARDAGAAGSIRQTLHAAGVEVFCTFGRTDFVASILASERARQQMIGYDAEHDDVNHPVASLAYAAAQLLGDDPNQMLTGSDRWIRELQEKYPGIEGRERRYVIAGALVMAAIEKMYREKDSGE